MASLLLDYPSKCWRGCGSASPHHPPTTDNRLRPPPIPWICSPKNTTAAQFLYKDRDMYHFTCTRFREWICILLRILWSNNTSTDLWTEFGPKKFKYLYMNLPILLQWKQISNFNFVTQNSISPIKKIVSSKKNRMFLVHLCHLVIVTCYQQLW